MGGGYVKTYPRKWVIMSVKQKYLKDENGEVFSPITSSQSVYTRDGEPIDNKFIIACYISTSTNSYNYGDYISFKKEIYNNSNGKIIFNSNGLITINHTGFIKVSYNIWLNGESNMRPWLQFCNYDNKETYIDSIDDNSSGYVTLSASGRVIPCTNGDRFGLWCATSNDKTFNVSNGSGRTPSYITIELI